MGCVYWIVPRPSSFLGSRVFVTRRSGGHSNDFVLPNLRTQHGPCAEFVFICIYLSVQNILDDYLFGYCLSHRLT
jgi:hypothetical protein